MPNVDLQITAGATREQKAAPVRDVTGSRARVLGTRPEHVHGVIQDIAGQDRGFEGRPTDECKRRRIDRNAQTPEHST